ncbi:flagellar motor switch protein FliG [Agromyces humi]|uniref:flagellar motor switch protein FliG n=1 Tax=Agromyces humi TaxID=1766800 RepID=UPI001F3EF9C0|nr:flagellar motor switch protein FliG [Agromyces humi]
MTTLTKDSLTGIQTTAIVLMNLDSDTAAEVLRQFSEDEAQEIASEIVKMRKVDADIVEQALLDYHEMVVEGRVGSRGGRDFAEDLLTASFGAEKAAGLMGKVNSSMAGRSFEFLDAADAAQVAALLEGEMPVSIATVMVHLRPVHASNILSQLKASSRTDVAEAIAKMSAATPEAVSLLATSLKSRAAAVVSPRSSAEVAGGIQPLVDIINRAPVDTEKAVLDGLEARNPELAEEIRSRLLTFADIVRLEARDVQLVLRGIEIAVLAVAMKGSPEPVQEKIRSNLSERNRDLLGDELNTLGQVRASQVEEARAEVVRAIRSLEQEGQITVHRAEEDVFVD